jgi:hypothetical protein
MDIRLTNKKERAMTKETVGLKLDADLAQKFQEIRKSYGSAQEFVEVLLNAHLEKQIETDTSSPVHKEKIRVKKALADIERVVTGFLEIAASEKIQAIEKANENAITAQETVIKLKKEAINQKESIGVLEKKTVEQEKIIAGLQESAENVRALKAAWGTEKENLTTKIAELGIETQEALKLKSKVMDLDKLLSESNGNHALSEQRHMSEQRIISDLKTRLADSIGNMKTGIQEIKQEHKEFLATLEAKHQQEISDLKKRLDQAESNFVNADNAFNAEKLACAEKVAEIKTAAAKEHGRLTGIVSSLQNSLAEKR